MSVPGPSFAYQSILDRALDLASDLATRCRVIDPDQSRGWSRIALQLLDGLNRFASSVETAPPPDASPQARTVLQLFLLNMLLLEAVSEHAAPTSPPEGALPPDIAAIIARFLVDVGLFVQGTYAAYGQGVPVQRYVQEAFKASTYLAPLETAFIAAMTHGDHDAASEAQRLLRKFMDAAAAGCIMPPPWEIAGEGQA